MINILLTLFWIIFYVFFQLSSVYGGDAGDLASAAFTGGVPHPPGFPLYTFIGYLITRFPIGTVAWKIGFLSSIPCAFSLLFLFLSLKKIYKQTLIPLVAVLSVGFSYPVWLFATTVEVLSLNAFFTSLAVYLILLWKEKRSDKIFLLFCFVYGLGFFHHQIIIFLLPGFLYFIYTNKIILPKNPCKKYIFPIFLFFLGALPYLYVYLAAQSIPAVMWGNPWNLKNLVALFLRDYYGTFYTGMTSAQFVATRLLASKLFFEYALIDFTGVGLLIMGIGLSRQIWRMVKKPRKNEAEIFILLLFIFSGPFYFFYASYILYGPFLVATAEKFLTFSYPFLSYYLCGGMIFIAGFLDFGYRKLANKIFTGRKSNPDTGTIFRLFMLVFPITIFFINYPKLSILKNDMTAENYAKDVLSTLPKNSLLFLQRDTAIFNTFYYYYAYSFRKDVKIFYVHRLIIDEYREQIKKYYPDLIIPQTTHDQFLKVFIAKNYPKFPIYSNTAFDSDSKTSDYLFVKYGLLYRIYRLKDLPEPIKTMQENEKLWANYTDPTKGSLGLYKNLFLGNVLDFYAESHQEFGTFLKKLKKYEKAIWQYKKAIQLNPNDKENYFLMSEAYFLTEKCAQAGEALEKAMQIAKTDEDKISFNRYFYAQYQLTKDCFKDEKKANKIYKSYTELLKKQELPIEKL